MLKGHCATLLAGILVTACISGETGTATAPGPGSTQSTTLADISKTDPQKINTQPLGSPGNPIRANGPAGQNAYLQRLKCANGPPPEVRRLGPRGVGPYGTTIEAYDLECDGDVHALYLDGHHPGHVEGRAPQGFVRR